ncbi:MULTISPECIES: peptidase domain-containing ABC transporter [Xanthomonas]|uniref:ABC-type bacteriocin/lantibiotic exporters, contain an N-terminal double-glycine peptidase domain n=1 Tax=Xanthomonas oryzae pv. oryzae (strain KACC10331 / KXO85) TaxID=291331 RepID=Q5H1Y9_XANOR|nr:peptidase domain-containing ABC transporter [Xanthomonas oryzae]AAW75032.1 ABC-type bacteriocin/lantibiotic exporters, contain an N-terminal double-glycine peptidase domain [Xanthomonas oryzae pv. oryzae KACC 10331]PNR44531.1 ABC transporter [Xanthomonas oryzae pv. oryzae]QBN94386.1 peptidase domain-containing ABC transporter [Xanthomonas oryzae pv. oryzae]QBN99178.1 peptidase domain-containing ABC transporter [Xanthomonas oryzae pv. oryzae]QIF21966.1 peptidase domain-containing ABC transpo
MKAIVQAEASECGLASLAMVASAHGMQLDLPELRRRFHLSLKGIRLNQLIEIAQTLGFSTRPLRLEMEQLDQLSLPCILHWDLNHFVVLAKVGKSKATILDPAIGERRLSLGEVSQHFTGVALELTPTAEFKQHKAAPSISARQLTGPIRGLWSALSQIALLSLALQVFVILAPFYTQWVVDQVLVSADRDLLVVLGLGFGLALLLQVGIGLLRGWSVVSLSSRLGLQWMGNVFAHLLKLPLDFFEKRHLGDVTSRMSSVQTIQHTLTTSFVEAMIDGVMAMVTLVLMLVYSWKLALVTLLAVALYLGIRAIAYRPMRDRTEQQLVAAAKQQTHLLESLRGMQSLKVAGEESVRRSTYENLLNDTVNQDVKLARMSLGFNTASQLVFGLERIAVIWIGARLALDNVFSVGMLVAYLAYKDQFAMRVSGLIDKWIEFRMLRLHGERLADIVLTPPEKQHAQPHALPPAEPSIEVEGLSFRYADGEPWVVKDCSFTIAPGESVAIIGGSGCGKTTLVKLLLGLLTPSEGTIRIGGHDLHKLGPRTVRAMIGVVMQDDQLFAGSIADNIGFFDTDFDLERIKAAAQLAAVHEDIAAMPMGYHSLIGDMGSSLSGGQKQRIILARALYRQPKLLFLDEATSHLDVTRERLVNEAVKHLQLTKVIVAHRPETIASADRILVMEHGRIVQEVKLQQSPEIPHPEDHVLSA